MGGRYLLNKVNRVGVKSRQMEGVGERWKALMEKKISIPVDVLIQEMAFST